MKNALLILLSLLLFGCQGTNTRNLTPNKVEEAMKEQIELAEGSIETKDEEVAKEPSMAKEEADIVADSEINPLTGVEESSIERKESDVDYDLTQMGPDMVFATVMNFMMSPDDYIGKSVRIIGNYYTLHDDQTGLDYQYCLVKDARQCCAQGLEFVLKDSSQGYPAQESYVTVEGIFETYTEGTHPDGTPILYSRLGDATIKIKE